MYPYLVKNVVKQGSGEPIAESNKKRSQWMGERDTTQKREKQK